MMASSDSNEGATMRAPALGTLFSAVGVLPAFLLGALLRYMMW
jgi:hypothetical protein